MNILKLFSLFLLLIGVLAIKDEEMARSPVSLEKAANDEQTSTEMELYEEDDDVDDMDDEVILEDEKALSVASDEPRLVKRNPIGEYWNISTTHAKIRQHGNEAIGEKRIIVCALRRLSCFLACRRVPRFLRGACRRVCNFGLRYANRAVCYVACRQVHPLIRGICNWVCRCLR